MDYISKKHVVLIGDIGGTNSRLSLVKITKVIIRIYLALNNFAFLKINNIRNMAK